MRACSIRSVPVGGSGRVVVLQPRRLAARMLAARVSRERGESGPGGEVGYRIRLDNVTSARHPHRVRHGRHPVAADAFGTFLARTSRRFSSTNFTSGICTVTSRWHAPSQIQETTRPDLRLVVMSATLETGRAGEIPRSRLHHPALARTDVSRRHRIPAASRAVRPHPRLGTCRSGTRTPRGLAS